jgi:hypothetical protein
MLRKARARPASCNVGRLRASAVALGCLWVISVAEFASVARDVWGAVAVLGCSWLVALAFVVLVWWESAPDAEELLLRDGFYGPF